MLLGGLMYCVTTVAFTVNGRLHSSHLERDILVKRSISLVDGSLAQNMYIPNPFARAGCDTRSFLYAEFNRFEFRDFFFLDRLPYQV